MSPLNSTKDLSVVTSLYDSSPYVDEFYRRASAAAARLTPNYEIVFVNDGSPDDALEKVLSLQAKDPHVIVVDLSRNFGHHQALMTGLAYASGKEVFIIDCDLEEEPEWMPLFRETQNTEGSDVVYGVQSSRKGGPLERISGWAFYKILNFFSRLPIPANATTARLMSRRYVDALLQYPERELFLHGLMPHLGYRQIPSPVQKHSKGKTSYSLARKLSLTVNAITSFSNKPLIYIFYVGLLISTVAGFYILWLVHLRIFHGIPLTGWASLIVSIWFLGGLTIFFIGIVGIYLAKVFSETKQRPRTIVRHTYPDLPARPPAGLS